MSIIEQAKDEMDRANFEVEERAAMVAILEIFFKHWDSGGAVWAMAPVLQRLIAGKPLGSLTGDDDEWVEVGEEVWQSKRCGTVFKQERPDLGEGLFCYDIDTPGRPAITFPYDPENIEVGSPVVEFETSEDRP